LAVTLLNPNRFWKVFHRSDDEIYNVRKTHIKFSSISLYCCYVSLWKCSTVQLLHCKEYVPCSTKWLADASLVYQHFEYTTGRHIIDDATGSACHQIEVGAVWSGDVNSDVACFRNLDSIASSVWERAVLQKDQELSWQLTRGTRIRELVRRIKEDILSTFCDSVNKELIVCGSV